jgi:hypothetical protein
MLKKSIKSDTFSLILNSGRTIRLTDMYLKETYTGAKKTTPKRNKILAELEADAPDLVAGVDSITIIEPEDSSEKLPTVTCIAHMISEPLDPENCTNASGLTIVWFQNEFMFPPAASMIETLKNLEWSLLADDFDD